MRISKQRLLVVIIAFVVVFFLGTYQLPFYVYQPGNATPLSPMVEVENGNESDGEMHLVTVSGGQATPIQYLVSTFMPHHEIMPIEQVHGDLTEEEYLQAQLQMMQNSQESSIVVAYEAAGIKVDYEYHGLYIMTVGEGMPAEGLLQVGDKLVGVDGRPVQKAEDLINYIDQKDIEDVVEIEVIRDDESVHVDVPLTIIDEEENKIGVGIGLIADRTIIVDPEVEISSGKIGGPSAGLMFALEIYDQLIEEDLTKGYNIIGTGGIHFDGTVYRIGGIDKKVVAAHRAGCDIFFAPYENGNPASNYEEAKQKAEEINTSMEIVPVDTFEDAVNYLRNLKPKASK